MNKFLKFSFGLSLIGLVSLSYADNASELAKDTGYYMGYNYAKLVDNQNIQFNEQKVLEGFKDSINNSKPKISKVQRQKELDILRMNLVAKKEKIENLNMKHSKMFLSEISKLKNIIKVKNDIYIQMLNKGKGEKPFSDSSITIEYRGTTPSNTYIKNPKLSLEKIKKGDLLGKTFDKNQDFSFKLSHLITCWKYAIKEVPVGSTFILYCSPEQAYGENAPPSIGPNQVLSFKITLKDFTNK